MFKLKKGKKDKNEDGDDINAVLGDKKRNKASRQAVDPAARPSYKVYDKSKQADVDADGMEGMVEDASRAMMAPTRARSRRLPTTR
jgi:hypothetical protein